VCVARAGGPHICLPSRTRIRARGLQGQLPALQTPPADLVDPQDFSAPPQRRHDAGE